MSETIQKGYETLEVFRLSKELAIKVHSMTLNLPKFEMYEQGGQVRRSSKLIPANIVEGYCLRRHKNEYLQYLHRAFGSCEETILHLEMLKETNSLRDGKLYSELHEAYTKLGKMLFRFIESVNSEHLSPMYVKDIDAEYDS